MNLEPKNYKGLFKTKGRFTCLHNEFLLKGSLGLGSPLVVCKENDRRSFISRAGEKLCLQKGLEIFSSEASYREYNEGFRAYISMAKKDIIPRFNDPQQKITEKELRELLPILGRFWYFYGITEFPYHDLAYKKFLETQNPVLKKNLDDLGKLKFEGRELLNAYIFEGGVLHRLLQTLGRQFLSQEIDTFFLFSNELLALYGGKKFSEILNERRQYHGCASLGGSIKIFTYQEAADVWNAFCSDKFEQGVISGVIANRGTASGRVVIAPMLIDMKEITKIDSRMEMGDILVAESTTPELMMLCKKAAAIVTDQSGMLSHAAIISRELNIPCVIGTGNATHVLQDGYVVEVNANEGIVKVISESKR